MARISEPTIFSSCRGQAFRRQTANRCRRGRSENEPAMSVDEWRGVIGEVRDPALGLPDKRVFLSFECGFLVFKVDEARASDVGC